ncbi:MAG TPA: Imm1 family immunity protein [Pseudonocardiaceae bacterium]|jgi:hypothetical protein|nr:Imm1 family immunity protein [Pseudonocardiaceae bacterium]
MPGHLDNHVDLSELPIDADVTGELHMINDQQSARPPCMWQFVVASEDNDDWGRGPVTWLDAGIAGTGGVLRWVELGHTFIPASGAERLLHDDDWLPYLDWSGTPCSVRGAAEVPIEQVFAAVAEVDATHHRPTCVDWIEVDRRRYRIVGPRVEFVDVKPEA